jgi:hypothetical protein
VERQGKPDRLHQPEARAWLTGRLTDLVNEWMVDTATGKETTVGGFKTDDGEFGNGSNTYIPETAAYDNGKAGKDFVNGYCVEYHKTAHGVLGVKGVLFARSGFHGIAGVPRPLGRRQRTEFQGRQRAAVRDRRGPVRRDVRVFDLGARRRWVSEFEFRDGINRRSVQDVGARSGARQ